MIEELQIKDLGVIANTVLPLGPGFTAITGETGAGKTMVVTALGLLMGERSDASRVRKGSVEAQVSGVVRLQENAQAVTAIVEDAGGSVEATELFLTRKVAAAGASKASVGGVRAPIGVLQQLADLLFCVHGQTDQLRLKSQAQQRDTLDRFGGAELATALSEYQSAYEACKSLSSRVVEITENRIARQRRLAQLEAETAEIIELDPQSDELTRLQQEVDRLGNAQALQEAVGIAVTALSGDESGMQADAQELIARAQRAVQEAAGLDSALEEIAANLDESLALVQTATSELLRYVDTLDGASLHDLEQTQQRIADLNDLRRKFGPELSDVLAYLETASAEIADLQDDDSLLQTLQAELAAAQVKMSNAATTLTELRQRAAVSLSAQVTAELQELALPDSQLQVAVNAAKPGKFGADEIEFLLIPHMGADPKPLAKAASGGELSRIMLALEVVLAQADPVPTFVFDEVDAGIGGQAAIEVGKRLARLAQTAQVIVVTHLAQVAAFASNHLRVVKDSDGGFTNSSCVQLAGEERLQEIARLLSGLSESASAKEHAQELLAMGAKAQESSA